MRPRRERQRYNQVLGRPDGTDAAGSADLAAEVAAREAADASLVQRILAEQSARVAGDNLKADTAALGAVAFSNSYADLDDKPTFVASITGTANQVIASAATGAVTLSLPQSIHTGATPGFAALTLTDGPFPAVTIDAPNGLYLDATAQSLRLDGEDIAFLAGNSFGAESLGGMSFEAAGDLLFNSSAGNAVYAGFIDATLIAGTGTLFLDGAVAIDLSGPVVVNDSLTVAGAVVIVAGGALIDTTALDALTFSATPTQAEVVALRDEVSSLLATLRVHS